jgi:tol-pal system protein YbgF
MKVLSRSREIIVAKNFIQRTELHWSVEYMFSKLPLLIAALFFCTASFAGIFDDDEARKRIESQQKRIDELEAKSQSLMDILGQIESLRVEINKLRGQMELELYRIETLEKRQKDLYVDLDNRLRRLESGAPAASGSSTPGSAATVDPAAENKAYEAAFNNFRTGNYQAAITGFQDFIKTYPNSSLAASAQYWIGNAYYALRDYKSAIANQQKLLTSYPENAKVPDALLNIASSQLELGDKASAKKTLQEIIAKHPSSDAADKAKRRLSTIK